MKSMLTIDEALREYAKQIERLSPEGIALESALGRVLAEPVASRVALPPFDQSAMDGYALRTEETTGATPQTPVRLKLTGRIAAGPLEGWPSLEPGGAMRIFTGGALPQGSDGVLRQEDALVQEGRLVLHTPVPPGENVRHQGEELSEGARIAPAGRRLTAGDIGAIANGGRRRVVVFRRPAITLFVTGDEIVAAGERLRPGQVYDANRPLVGGWLGALGLNDVRMDHLPDSLEGTAEALAQAFQSSDLVLTTGGVSVGDHDYVMSAADRIGVHSVFWKVKQRPGKPLFFGMLGQKILLGLPGNPGSVFACLALHVRRVLELLEGASDPEPLFSWGRLDDRVTPSGNRDWWLRCRAWTDSDGLVHLAPLADQGSHMIGNLGAANALARIPAGSHPLGQGTRVSWTPLAPLKPSPAAASA